MKSRAGRAALLLLLVFTGCAHKNKQAQQSQQLAPPVLETNPPPPSAPIDLPPSKAEANIPPFPKPQVKPPAPAKHPHKSKQTSPATTPGAVQQASTATPEVSAVGHLGSSETSDERNGTERSIYDVEHGLNGINRKMSDQELHTAAQIREFLKQARTALSTGDMDGAQTLVTKARVLLSELNR